MAAGLMASQAAIAVDGDVDLTFGDNGIATAGVTDANFELPPKPVVQPDGRILICSMLETGGPSGSDMLIARFNADGTPDMTFSFDGKVTIDFDSRDEGCNALALQDDGKIVAIGTSTDEVTTNADFAAARLDSDGALDETFGAGSGEVLIPFDVDGGLDDTAGAVAMQADGKIVIAGWVISGSDNYDFGVTRLMPDGTRDTTFNSTGRVTIAFDFPGSSNGDQGDSVFIDDSGRIVVGGIAQSTSNSSDFALARLLPNGQLDHSFDADGRATIGFDIGDTDSDLSYQAIQTHDGKIVMVGAADTGSGATNNDIAVARVLQDGSPDPSFGIGGKVVVPFDIVTNGGDVGTGLVEDSAGRIVVAGVGFDASSTNGNAVALRLLSDGALDQSFGSFGKKIYDFDGDRVLFTGITLQGTQLIACGLRSTGGEADDFVVRLDVDLIFANGFE
ncbi:MAG TPA: hypothetical protein VJ696_14120 [Rhodanobacteraceae bacterium]|nr:hypothetical protein [Rhodanobacteraceae bacterium]